MQIERARMHLELVCPSNVGKELKKRAKALGADITSETWGASLRMEVLALPGAFRPLHDAVQELGKGAHCSSTHTRCLRHLTSCFACVWRSRPRVR